MKFVWLLVLGLVIYVVIVSVGFFASAKLAEIAPHQAAQAGRTMRMQKIALFDKSVDLGTALFGFVQPLFGILWLMMLSFGAGSVSSDLRNNALPLYFSRPLTPWLYAIGKVLGLSLFPFLAMVACVILVAIQYMAYFLTIGESFAEIPTLISCIVYLAMVCFFFAVVMAGISSTTRTSRVAGVAFLMFFVATQWLANSLGPASLGRTISPRHSLNAIGRFLLNPNFNQISSSINIDAITTLSAVVSIAIYCSLFAYLLRRNLRVVEIVK